MPDNITTPAIGTVLATKDIGGVQFPRSLLTDASGSDIAGDNPLPVEIVAGGNDGGLTDDELRAAPVPVSITGAAIAALQDSAPADDLFAITPGATALETVPKALLVTAAGTLAVGGVSNTSVSLGTVAVGQIIPIRARYVYATGTTATVVGLI